MEAASIDLTPIIVAVIGGVFSILGALAVAIINKYVTDRRMAMVLENAVQNSLGIVQQAATGLATRSAPHVGVSSDLAPGVQYVLDHAPEAIAHFNLTPDKIAEKIVSRIGLKQIATNIAATTSSASPAIVPPLSPMTPAAQVIVPGADTTTPIA